MGLPTGPRLVVPSSWALTSSGPRRVVVVPVTLETVFVTVFVIVLVRLPEAVLAALRLWMTRAAAPLVIAALKLVPEPTKFAFPIRAVGNDLSSVEPGDL